MCVPCVSCARPPKLPPARRPKRETHKGFLEQQPVTRQPTASARLWGTILPGPRDPFRAPVAKQNKTKDPGLEGPGGQTAPRGIFNQGPRTSLGHSFMWHSWHKWKYAVPLYEDGEMPSRRAHLSNISGVFSGASRWTQQPWRCGEGLVSGLGPDTQKWMGKVCAL